MSTGIQLTAKMFLEGKEVPFIGATITSTVNQACLAYVDVVPHKTINNIKPKTLVHIFTRDFSVPGGSNPYILAFEGEVFGFSFSKTPSSRNMSLSCMDLSNYWDNVLIYFLNAEQSLGKGTEELGAIGRDEQDAIKQGISTPAVTHSVSSYFIQILKKIVGQPRTDGTTADFLDGFVGVYREVSKINDFYNLAEDRLRITDRIVLKSSGELGKILKQQEALDWFQGVIGRNTGFSSLRLVIQDLMSLIFHDFVSVPFPSRVVNPRLTKDKGIQKDKSPAKTNAQFVFKPNLYMVPPPACNIFFPDEYSSFNFNRNFMQETTRLIYKPEMPSGFTGEAVRLPHVYAPATFRHFMQGKGALPSDLIGDGDVLCDEDFGHFNDKDTSAAKETNNGVKREGQFLTNEEKMKGILMDQENMVPATTQFRASLSDAGKQTFSEGVANYLFYKKRFQTREVQITSHLKMSVLPGFTCLVLDDSEADQTVIAYCSSVTHRIYATQGGYTNVVLSYARTVGEQDVASGKIGEPLIPPWFAAELFGEVKDGEVNVGAKLSEFYASLIGDIGSKCVPDLMGVKTMTQAAKKLAAAYRKQREKGGPDGIRMMIASYTRRDYVQMKEAFGFIGAKASSNDLTLPWLEFFGDRISGKNSRDSKQIKARRSVIDSYRTELKNKRGFRG